MALTRFWKRFKRVVQAKDKYLLSSLRSRSEMQTILTYQRSLADRHGQEFSLVVFSQQRPQASGEELGRLADVVLRRCRSTDEVGWFEEDQIGAILPCTPIDGAWKFADGVCKIMAKTSTVPVCTVYAYPSDQFPREGRDKRQRRSSNVAPDSDALSVGSSLSDADTRNSTLVATLVASTAQPKIAPSRPVERMETLFLSPLPRWKRASDIAGSLVGLVVASPILLVTAIAIKLTSKGPVIFKQQRAGLGGRPFTMYKFRSMCVDAEDQKKDLLRYNERTGPAFKMTKDPRIEGVGCLLRKASLDELPQLFNVFKGDMSLVGPRPLPIDEASKHEQWQERRLHITPGVTCLWQVHARHDKSFDRWARLDIQYATKQSPLLDLKILLMTLPAVLSRKGAN